VFEYFASNIIGRVGNLIEITRLQGQLANKNKLLTMKLRLMSKYILTIL